MLITLTSLLLFVCAFIRSAVGFGDALLAIPLLGLMVSLPTASPVVALAGFTMSSTILVTNRQRVEFASAWRLIAASLIGVPLGVLLINAAPEATVRTILGFVLIGYGGYSLISPRLPEVRHDRYAVLFGLVAGILGGAYNTSGPPVVVYGTLRRWPPERFRATLQCYFICTEIAILAGHGFGGLWTTTVLRLYFWSLPAIGLGVYLGGRISRRIPKETFGRIICTLIVAIGLLFLFSSHRITRVVIPAISQTQAMPMNQTARHEPLIQAEWNWIASMQRSKA